MTLNELVYIIDGSLEVAELGENDKGEPAHEATLYDNVHDPCMLQGKDLKPEPVSKWEYATAQARGRTEQEALEALAERVAGTLLGHDWPIMWKSHTQWTRVPPTLIAGEPTVTRPVADVPSTA